MAAIWNQTFCSPLQKKGTSLAAQWKQFIIIANLRSKNNVAIWPIKRSALGLIIVFRPLPLSLKISAKNPGSRIGSIREGKQTDMQTMPHNVAVILRR